MKFLLILSLTTLFAFDVTGQRPIFRATHAFDYVSIKTETLIEDSLANPNFLAMLKKEDMTVEEARKKLERRLTNDTARVSYYYNPEDVFLVKNNGENWTILDPKMCKRWSVNMADGTFYVFDETQNLSKDLPQKNNLRKKTLLSRISLISMRCH